MIVHFRCVGAGLLLVGATFSAAQFPVTFEIEASHPSVSGKFVARSAGFTAVLTRSGVEINPTSGEIPVGLRFIDAKPDAVLEPLQPRPSVSNYLVGPDPKNWRTGVPHYGRVRYRGVYPGIDVEFYGNDRNIEFDFIIAPGADPNRVRLGFDGAGKLRVDKQGDIALYGNDATLTLKKPRILQEGVELPGRYVLRGDHEIGFEIANYNPAKTLIIDPVITYSSYFGGVSDEAANAVAVDSSGNAYIAGYTASLPTSAGTGVSKLGAGGGAYDAFISKYNPAGTQLLYTTYIGGSGNDEAFGVAVDSLGDVYLTGSTSSADFPTTAGSFKTAYGGGTSDAFLLKLNPAGTALLYSSFIGGTGDDTGYGLALDAANQATVVGSTSTANLATTSGVFRPSYGGGISDGFVFRMNAAGTASIFSTYLGGSDEDAAYGVALDASGNSYITGYTLSSNFPTTAGVPQANSGGGYDAFVVGLNLTGGSIYSTYLGGANADYGWGVAADSAGNAYVTGFTASTDFPKKTGAFQAAKSAGYDAFVTKINPAGSSLVYSTFLGGTGEDYGQTVAIDAAGNAYIAGETTSADFPRSTDATTSALSGTASAFVTKLNPAGSLLAYSTYLGGRAFETAYGIAVDALGAAYVAGYTLSEDYPVSTLAPQKTLGGASDAFLTKLTPCAYSLNPVSVLAIAGASSGSFQVTAAAGCAWVTASDSSWLKVSSGSPGSGNGTVGYTVDANTLAASRTGAIAVADKSFTLTQSGISTFTISGSAGVAGAAVALSGSQTASATADGSGNYAFPNLAAGGNYMVTPSRANYTFTPASAAINNLASNSIANFSAAISTGKPDKVGTTYSGFSVLDANGNFAWDGPTTDKIISWSTFQASEKPIYGDWNGDGKMKVGVYNNGTWLLDYNGNGVWDGPTIDKAIFWSTGQSTDVPVLGDWNGDGRTKIGIYNNGTWILDYNGNGVWEGPSVDKTIYWSTGQAGELPVVGDWNGDGKSKIGIYANGTWILEYNGNYVWDGTGVDKLIYFGGPGYRPMVGDWNGSGWAKIGAYHVNGTWALDYNGNFVWDGTSIDRLTFFGGPEWTPVVGDWSGSGTTKIGAYTGGQWALDYNGNFGWDVPPDRLFSFGAPGQTPIVGKW